MESTRKKLEASEEKRIWKQELLKWWRHQKYLVRSTSSEAHFTRTTFHQKLIKVKL